jgi:hypothetical protein
VTLSTQDGETIGSHVLGAGPLELPLRVGEITVSAAGAGWQAFNEQVTVEEGKTATVRIQAKAATRPVTLKYLPSAELDLEIQQADGSWGKVKNAEQIFFNAAGVSTRTLNLAAGRYRVRTKGRSQEFDVKVDTTEISLREDAWK